MTIQRSTTAVRRPNIFTGQYETPPESVVIITGPDGGGDRLGCARFLFFSRLGCFAMPSSMIYKTFNPWRLGRSILFPRFLFFRQFFTGGGCIPDQAITTRQWPASRTDGAMMV